MKSDCFRLFFITLSTSAYFLLENEVRQKKLPIVLENKARQKIVANPLREGSLSDNEVLS